MRPLTPTATFRTTFVCISAGLAIVYIFANIYTEWRGLFHIHYVGYDFAFFYHAFRDILHDHTNWDNIYNPQSQHQFLKQFHFPTDPNNQYVYPPQFAWLFSWVGLFPFWLSLVLWMVITVAAYFYGIYWVMRTVWRNLRRGNIIAAFLIAAVLTPFQVDLAVGNVNSILFASIALSLYVMFYRNQPLLAGIPLGLAVLIKVTPIAILLIFLLRKQWKICISTVVTVLVITSVCTVFVGISPIFQYVVHFFDFGRTSMKNGPAPFNQSLLGVLAMFQRHAAWMSPRLPDLIFTVSSLVGLVIIVRVVLKSGNDNWRLDMALASLLPLIFSPLLEEPHMVFTIPPLLVMTWYANHLRLQRSVSPFLVLLIWVIAFSIVAESLPMTFLLNAIVSHWPRWYFVHIQMFVVLVGLFLMTLMLYGLKINNLIEKP